MTFCKVGRFFMFILTGLEPKNGKKIISEGSFGKSIGNLVKI
jgi:hypothetical protein